MASAEVSAAAPSGAYRNWMMVLLTAAFALNLLDRQIINVLAEPIKKDLGLADWQLGALTGTIPRRFRARVTQPAAAEPSREEPMPRTVGQPTA